MFSVFWMSTPRPCFAVYMAAQAFMSKSMTSVLRYTHWRCHWSVSMPSTCLAPFYQSNHHSPLCAVSSTPLYNVTQALRTRSVVFFPLFFSFFVTSQVFFHIFLLHSFCFCPTVMRGSCYYSQYFQRAFFLFSLHFTFFSLQVEWLPYAHSESAHFVLDLDLLHKTIPSI